MPSRSHRRRRSISRQTLDSVEFLLRYSHSRDAYILRGIGNWVGPVFVLRPRGDSAGDGSNAPGVPEAVPAAVAAALGLLRIDFHPTHRQPSGTRMWTATLGALCGSLAADALLVAVGTAVFPATKAYGHFQFSDYSKLTVIGVVIACVAWPIVTRISSTPRWLFFRLAIAVSLVLFLPDVWILAKGQPADAVGILMCMHVAIALVTYNSLVHISAVSTRQVATSHSAGR